MLNRRFCKQLIGTLFVGS